MIQIIGPKLSQWDTGRRIRASGSNATHAHLANWGDSHAVIMELVDGEAKIPDYLLQTGKDLNIYLVLDGITQESNIFPVRKRERPENYVYEDDRRNYIYKLITDAQTATNAANQAAQDILEAKNRGDFNGPRGINGNDVSIEVNSGTDEDGNYTDLIITNVTHSEGRPDVTTVHIVTIRDGKDAEAAVKTVNGIAPDENGNVEATPYIIQVTGNDAGTSYTLTGEFNWEEIVEHIHNGKPVICEYTRGGRTNQILPLVEWKEEDQEQGMFNTLTFGIVLPDKYVQTITIEEGNVSGENVSLYVITDRTLKKSGSPADAFVVGNKLGDIETALDAIIALQDELIGNTNTSEIITFTINGTEYTALSGMTWEEWCDSEYNTDGYIIYEDAPMSESLNDTIGLSDSGNQSATDIIIDGGSYELL